MSVLTETHGTEYERDKGKNTTSRLAYIELIRVTGKVDTGENILTHWHEDLFEDGRDLLLVFGY